MINEAIVGTVDWLAAELARGHAIERVRIAALVVEFRQKHPEGDSIQFAEFLLSHSTLTPYQLEKVLEGESDALGLGPYVLAEPIGAGGMGVVYRAEGRADRRAYAIKLVPPHGDENLRLARRQVRAFADLPPHPALVPCVDVGATAERHYLVWPFVAGESLESYVARHGPLSWADAVRLAVDLADGLHLAHEHGLSHGLLTPANVMIGDDGVARLLDFGTGALLADDESELAAEDQYGLGVVLHFAVTGRPGSHQVSFDAVPGDLAEVIDRLLADSPADRYRDFGEVVRRLQPSLDVTHTELDRTRLSALTDTPAELPHSSAERPPLTAATVAPADPKAPLLRRIVDTLMFWRAARDAVAVSILAPPELRPGEPAALAIFAHGSVREIQPLSRTYFPGHVLVGSVALRHPVVRGERLTAHLALPGLTVEPAVQKFVWAGQSLPLPCSVRVPADFRPGELVGVLSLARGDDVVLNHEFRVVVRAA